MKVKLKPPYELSDEDQIIIRNLKLEYNQEYTILRSRRNSFYLEWRKSISGFWVYEYYFDIIEENMPTKEQIIEAASTSKEAKDALVKLFPQYFEDEKYLSVEQLKIELEVGIAIRKQGNFEKKGYYLPVEYNWEIVKDDLNYSVLIPTKKL